MRMTSIGLTDWLFIRIWTGDPKRISCVGFLMLRSKSSTKCTLQLGTFKDQRILKESRQISVRKLWDLQLVRKLNKLGSSILKSLCQLKKKRNFLIGVQRRLLRSNKRRNSELRLIESTFRKCNSKMSQRWRIKECRSLKLKQWKRKQSSSTNFKKW